uniref:Uncharacterized protein n=1 Tax=Prolemur simus TaxID=1328070 RepID=A0A8C9DLV2_PROSS
MLLLFSNQEAGLAFLSVSFPGIRWEIQGQGWRNRETPWRSEPSRCRGHLSRCLQVMENMVRPAWLQGGSIPGRPGLGMAAMMRNLRNCIDTKIFTALVFFVLKFAQFLMKD